MARLRQVRIAGDIRIELADVELLTIQIRRLVCSLDKAQEIGMDWWKTDPRLSTSRRRVESWVRSWMSCHEDCKHWKSISSRRGDVESWWRYLPNPEQGQWR